MLKKDLHFEETRFGFEWGVAKITRMASDNKKGWVILGLETPKYKGGEIQLYITKTGKVRIWMGHEELTKKGKK